MQYINQSVGLGGRNRTADVIIVQQLLQQAGVSPGPVDGRIGRLTIHAIERFQQRVLRRPDGRVDVRGPTWRRLAASPTVPAVRVPLPGAARRPAPRSQRGSAPTQASPITAPAAGAVPRGSAFWKAPTALPSRNAVNRGLTSPGPDEQIQRFGGRPSETLYRNGGPATNRKLLALLVTEPVGPFRVTGLRPAVASLREVMTAVRRALPELYGLLGNAGMFNNRLQRGSSTKLSNHAFGTAIDFYIDGFLTQRGSHASNRGLDALAPYFNAAGWYWGATFGTDDAMHFECSTSLLDRFGI